MTIDVITNEVMRLFALRNQPVDPAIVKNWADYISQCDGLNPERLELAVNELGRFDGFINVGSVIRNIEGRAARDVPEGPTFPRWQDIPAELRDVMAAVLAVHDGDDPELARTGMLDFCRVAASRSTGAARQEWIATGLYYKNEWRRADGLPC